MYNLQNVWMFEMVQKKKNLTPASDWKKKKKKNTIISTQTLWWYRDQAETMVLLKNWKADRGGTFYNGIGFLICEGFEF